MTGDNKPFPPSSLKLDKLRNQGIIPLSLLSLRVAACSGLLIALLQITSYRVEQILAKLLSLWTSQQLQQNHRTADVLKELWSAFELSISLLIFLGIIISCTVLVTGLIQSRFFFKPNLLAPSLLNLRDKQNNPRSRFGRQMCSQIGIAIVMVILFFYLLRSLSSSLADYMENLQSPDLSSQITLQELSQKSPVADYLKKRSKMSHLSNHTEQSELFSRSITLGGKQLKKAVLIILTTLVILGILSIIFCRLFYLLDHRMSREELEGENAEDAPKQSTIQAQKETQADGNFE